MELRFQRLQSLYKRQAIVQTFSSQKRVQRCDNPAGSKLLKITLESIKETSYFFLWRNQSTAELSQVFGKTESEKGKDEIRAHARQSLS